MGIVLRKSIRETVTVVLKVINKMMEKQSFSKGARLREPSAEDSSFELTSKGV
ncbi:MAG: Unknown protein [uncultured Campylobacterales bacterium]|uniref:Uncharacterized protein n=1 Tax=uncultured Campylobacterales bacterium TaxID=352960 RepID=A0A6S6S4I4_9BACT|nr:MAG: Unknown protein [uncultured Campylobacterales bacterium]